MLTGSTGAGKSSTINALFNMDVAKVGVGVDPETSIIEKFILDNLVIWDTPGLGDGVENDERISRSILEKINELDEDGNPLIDLVVVVMDSSSKDLVTSYELINNILIPALGDDEKDRILLALNQADVAMEGTHWNEETNSLDEVLKVFLKKKADSVRNRIKEATGLSIRPSFIVQATRKKVESSVNLITLQNSYTTSSSQFLKTKDLLLRTILTTMKTTGFMTTKKQITKKKSKAASEKLCGIVLPTDLTQELKLVEISWESLAKLLVPR
jgi:predicted GTPase